MSMDLHAGYSEMAAYVAVAESAPAQAADRRSEQQRLLEHAPLVKRVVRQLHAQASAVLDREDMEQIGLMGLLGAVASGTFAGFGLELPWYVWSYIAIALVAVLGYRQVDLSAKVLVVLVALEFLIVVALNAVILVKGGAAGLNAVPFQPSQIFRIAGSCCHTTLPTSRLPAWRPTASETNWTRSRPPLRSRRKNSPICEPDLKATSVASTSSSRTWTSSPTASEPTGNSPTGAPMLQRLRR